jgi:hypothetical protein
VRFGEVVWAARWCDGGATVLASMVREDGWQDWRTAERRWCTSLGGLSAGGAAGGIGVGTRTCVVVRPAGSGATKEVDPTWRAAAGVVLAAMDGGGDGVGGGYGSGWW